MTLDTIVSSHSSKKEQVFLVWKDNSLQADYPARYQGIDE
jgi:hypothetical protein